MKKALALSVLMFSAVVSAAESDYDEFITNNSVTYEKTDGNGQASLSIVNPVVNLSTTKDYAQYIMDSYQGWDLKPVIDLRGFSFKFVDNAPCSGLVTYFDGRAYLLFKACGKVSEADLKTLFNRANQKLKLEETLKNSLGLNCTSTRKGQIIKRYFRDCFFVTLK